MQCLDQNKVRDSVALEGRGESLYTYMLQSHGTPSLGGSEHNLTVEELVAMSRKVIVWYE